MNKSELIDALQNETGLTKTKTADVVDLFFGEMTKALAKGNRVEIRGFCSIYVRNYKGYTGRNPKTGEEIPISQRRVVTFRPGQKLKTRVEGYAGRE